MDSGLLFDPAMAQMRHQARMQRLQPVADPVAQGVPTPATPHAGMDIARLATGTLGGMAATSALLRMIPHPLAQGAGVAIPLATRLLPHLASAIGGIAGFAGAPALVDAVAPGLHEGVNKNLGPVGGAVALGVPLAMMAMRRGKGAVPAAASEFGPAAAAVPHGPLSPGLNVGAMMSGASHQPPPVAGYGAADVASLFPHAQPSAPFVTPSMVSTQHFGAPLKLQKPLTTLNMPGLVAERPAAAPFVLKKKGAASVSDVIATPVTATEIVPVSERMKAMRLSSRTPQEPTIRMKEIQAVLREHGPELAAERFNTAAKAAGRPGLTPHEQGYLEVAAEKLRQSPMEHSRVRSTTVKPLEPAAPRSLIGDDELSPVAQAFQGHRQRVFETLAHGAERQLMAETDPARRLKIARTLMIGEPKETKAALLSHLKAIAPDVHEHYANRAAAKAAKIAAAEPVAAKPETPNVAADLASDELQDQLKPQAGASAAVPSVTAAIDPAEHVLKTMEQFRDHDKGALVTSKELREASGLDKPTFDKAVYDLAGQGKVMPHKHDFATSLKPDELGHLVDTSIGDAKRGEMHANDGRYWVGVAKRRADVVPEPASFHEPKEVSNAISPGQVTSGSVAEHPNGNGGREAAEAGSGNRPVGGGEVQAKSENRPAVGQKEVAAPLVPQVAERSSQKNRKVKAEESPDFHELVKRSLDRSELHTNTELPKSPTHKQLLADIQSEVQRGPSFLSALKNHGLYTNGRFAMTAPEKLRVGAPDAPDVQMTPRIVDTVKSMMHSLVSDEPASIVAGKLRQQYGSHHTLLRDSTHNSLVDSRYLAAIKNEYPDATFHLAGSNDPVVARVGKKPVGVIMPLNQERGEIAKNQKAEFGSLPQIHDLAEPAHGSSPEVTTTKTHAFLASDPSIKIPFIKAGDGYGVYGIDVANRKQAVELASKLLTHAHGQAENGDLIFKPRSGSASVTPIENVPVASKKTPTPKGATQPPAESAPAAKIEKLSAKATPAKEPKPPAKIEKLEATADAGPIVNPYGDTPTGKAYVSAKKSHPGAIVLQPKGDFYEIFGRDAEQAAKSLGLSVTTLDKNSKNPIPMAGFPKKLLEGHLKKLMDAGHKVAISEAK